MLLTLNPLSLLFFSFPSGVWFNREKYTNYIKIIFQNFIGVQDNDEFKEFLTKLDIRYLKLPKDSFVAYAKEDIDNFDLNRAKKIFGICTDYPDYLKDKTSCWFTWLPNPASLLPVAENYYWPFMLFSNQKTSLKIFKCQENCVSYKFKKILKL